MPSIVSIVYKPDNIESKPANHFARVPLDRAELIAGKGIAGDRKGNGDDRHLNVMSRETLDRLAEEGCKTGPGEMGEQIVVSGLDLATLPNGARIKVGNHAEIEIIKPRTGCSRFEAIQGISPKAVSGRLGAMCRVTIGGAIHIGDAVTVGD